MDRINFIMSELAKYNRLLDETTEIIDSLKDEIKVYMINNNLDTITGEEHKATYKTVTCNRIDTTALKKELPDVATRYTKTTENMRFTFA